MKTIILNIGIFLSVMQGFGQTERVWSPAQSSRWFATKPWIVGCNFIPSSAVNELEMWQAATFDTLTIARELGWAQAIGMNTVRVFLHFIAWQEDPSGFKTRIKKYLAIASARHIQTIFVFFDDCWNDSPVAGPQPAPKTGVHNSGWMQSPGKKLHNDPSSWNMLKRYEQDILTNFRRSADVLLWDLYNEPGNGNYNEASFPLLKKSFEWAWQVRPWQPITAGIWYNNQTFNRWQLTHSDVITFHNYDSAAKLTSEIVGLELYHRPLICTEYMARTRGSRFQTHLPIFKKYHVGAISWGLVCGKTNTIYEWGKPVADGSEPPVWFHDIFRKNGQPFDARETAFIKQITNAK